MANSHWPARAPRNTARLKASSDKKARDDFLEDRWGIKGLGYMQSEDPGENPKYKLQGQARSDDRHSHPFSEEMEGYSPEIQERE